MITYTEGKTRFNYRVAGVTLSAGKILLQRLEQDGFWVLPGGRCELLENSATALRREYAEELGVLPTIVRPLWLVENFFVYDDLSFHELPMIYKTDLPRDSVPYSLEEFSGKETAVRLRFKWFPLDEVGSITLYPSFLRKRLDPLPERLEHIIHHET